MTIREIIIGCGGPKRVAEASSGTANPVDADAVMKWYGAGVRDVHWPLLLSLNPSLTVEDIYEANIAARQGRQRGPLALSAA